MAEWIKQTSFTAGELSPALYGRTDLDHYALGLKTAKNVIVSYHGGVLNRPGTEFVCEVADSASAARIIPFQYSTTLTYVLELGDQTLRVVKEGAQITSGASPYEIATPWVPADLFRLKFDQDAASMFVVHPSYTVRELTSAGDTSWTLSATTFGPGISAPGGAPTISAYSTGTSVAAYVVTAESDADVPEESLASAAVTQGGLDLAQTVELDWTANLVAGADRYFVYKDQGKAGSMAGVYGYIGVSDNGLFTDQVYDPDFTITPPESRTVFGSPNNYPGTVAFFQQRLLLAGSNNEPQKLFSSKVGLYKNFLFSKPNQDDDSITYEIKGRQIQEIRHLVPLRELIALTSSGEWILFGGQDSAITPNNIASQAEGYRGASHVQPVIIGDSALYIQAKGNTVRDLRYSLEADGFAGSDLTVRSTHLFEGYEIVDWDYAQVPYSAVFAVRDDGALLILTYMPDHQVWGWTRHETDGEFESVCSVSEGDEDAVYFVVKRTINGSTKRYIERLASRQFTDVRDAKFLDSFLTFDGRNTGSTTMTVSGAGYGSGAGVTITASSGYFVSGDVGNTITVRGTDSSGNAIFARLEITAYTSTTVVSAECVTDVPSALQATATTNWEKGVDSLSGLDHLEGKSVRAYGDGSDLGTFTVASGAITLDEPCAVVHVGLSYTSEVELLDLDGPTSETVRNSQMCVNEAAVVVRDTRGIKVGTSTSDLNEVKMGWEPEAYVPEPLHTGTFDARVESRWERGASLIVRQDTPLPMTILSVMRNVEISSS